MFEDGHPPASSAHASQQELSGCRVTAIALNAVIGDRYLTAKGFRAGLRRDDVVSTRAGDVGHRRTLDRALSQSLELVVIACSSPVGFFVFGLRIRARARWSYPARETDSDGMVDFFPFSTSRT